MTGARIAVPLGLAVALAVAALAVLPRAYEAERLLSSQDDPVALADRAVARSRIRASLSGRSMRRSPPMMSTWHRVLWISRATTTCRLILLFPKG
jgi:hypothetical protein